MNQKIYDLQNQVFKVEPLLRDIRLRDLEVLVAVCRLGSVRLTAREFRLEPSQVSRVIKSLENAVGEVLFHRSVGGVALTPSGQRVHEIAVQLLTQTKFLRGPKKKSKILGLASANYLVQNLLPGCVTDLNRSDPDVYFRILELFPDQMIFPAIKGAFEIAIHTGAIEWPSAWVSEKIGDLEWGFYARSEHPLFKSKKGLNRSPFSPSDLLEYPFILPFDFSIESGFRFRDDRSPLSLHSRKSGFEVQRADIATEILLATDQLAHLPSIVTHRMVSSGKLRQVVLSNTPKFRIPLLLSVQASSVSSRVLRSLRKSLIRQLEECRQVQESIE